MRTRRFWLFASLIALTAAFSPAPEQPSAKTSPAPLEVTYYYLPG